MNNRFDQSRKEILWNIRDPGDPYDITKSMIKKLPGQQRLFMGDNLQLVCLFQAAQIQRLTLYLNEHILKYRQIQRQSLDRHSYEIQIKQLTEKFGQCDSQRKDNIQTVKKLKEFLQRQSKQLEEYKDKQKSFANTKYTEAIKQLDIFMAENNKLKLQNNQFIMQIQQLTAKLSSIDSFKAQQIEQIRRQYSSYEREMEQLKYRHENEIRNLELQLKRYKQQNQSNLLKINQLEYTLRDYGSKINNASSKSQQFYKLQRDLAQAINSKGILKNEIQRLSLINQERQSQSNSLRDQLRINQQEIFKYKNQSSSIQYKIQSYETKIHELEERLNHSHYNQTENQKANMNMRKMEQALAKLSHQIDRLNGVLKTKVNQNQVLQKRLRECEYQLNKIQILKREHQQLARRNSQLQNKIAIYAQELERLNKTHQGKVDESHTFEIRYQSIVRENEQLKLRFSTIQKNMNEEMRSKIYNYEQAIATYRRENEDLKHRLMSQGNQNRKISDYQNKIALLSQQVERLNQMLQRINHEKISLNNQILEFSSMKSTVSHYETRLRSSSKQNQELKNQLRESINNSRVIHDYQQKLGSLATQIQRLNGVLHHTLEKMKTIEENLAYYQKQNQNLKKQLIELSQNEGIIRQKQYQNGSMKQKLDNIIAQCNQLQEQNNRLKQRIGQLQNNSHKSLGQNQQKIVSMSHQIQRLNGVLRDFKNENDELRNKSRSIIEFETRITTYQRQITSITQQLQTVTFKYQQADRNSRQLENKFNYKVQQTNNDFQKRLLESEAYISNLTNEIQGKNKVIANFERNIGDLNNKLKESDVKQRQYHQKLGQMAREIERLNDHMKRINQDNQQLTLKVQNYIRIEQQIGTEHNNVQKRVQEYEGRIALMSQQIERLTQSLDQKTRQIRQIQFRYNALNEQLQKYKRKIQAYELNGNQLSGQLRNAESMIRQSQSTMQDYKQKLIAMSRQIERLNDNLKRVTNENTQLMAKIQSYAQSQQQNSHGALALQRKVQQFQSKISMMASQNDRLKQALDNNFRESNERNRQFEELKFKFRQTDETNRERELRLQRSFDQIQTLTHKLQAYESNGNELGSRLRDAERQLAQATQRLSSASQQIQRLKRLNIQNQSKNTSILRTMAEYQNKIALQSQQIQRLNQLIQKQFRDSNTFQRQIQQSRSTILALQSSYRQLQSKHHYSLSQIEHLTKLLNQGHLSLSSFQQKARQYIQQIQRLNNTLRIKVEETKRWQIKGHELEQMLRMQRARNQQMTDTYEKLNDQYVKARSGLKEYEVMIMKLNQQFGRLHEIIKTQKLKCEEHESCKLQIRVLQQQVTRLRQESVRNAEHIERLTQHRCHEADLHKRVEEHMSLFVVLFCEIESLRARLVSKQNEIENVRRSSLAPFMN